MNRTVEIWRDSSSQASADCAYQSSTSTILQSEDPAATFSATTTIRNLAFALFESDVHISMGRGDY